jgi:phosphatidylglycerol:prolipoprotein diacylglycerol transferase
VASDASLGSLTMIIVPTAPWAHIVFDLLAWSGAASLGVALSKWRLRGAIEHVAHEAGPGYFAAVIIGALPEAWLAGSFNTLREAAASLSHSIAGALAGAIVAVELYKLARGIRASTGFLFVGPFALGVAIGRWGCLFAGLPDDTYGTPTALPWGVDLGDGIARHPVQIYESLSMAAFLVVYLLALRRDHTWAIRRGFYVLVAWYGAQRFVWEFLKPYPPVFGPFNVFHLICLGLVIYGCCFFIRDLGLAGAPGLRSSPAA